MPPWLVIGAWCYLGLRIAHSLIHCTYNRVMHRLAMFALSFGLLVALWVVYVLALWSKGVRVNRAHGLWWSCAGRLTKLRLHRQVDCTTLRA